MKDIMKARRVFMFLLMSLVILAQANKPLTHDDVVQMVKAGFGEETVIKAIQGQNVAFDTSVQGLMALKNAGVSERAIAAILDRQSQAASNTAPADPWPPELSGMPRETGIYYKRTNAFMVMYGKPVAAGHPDCGVHENRSHGGVVQNPQSR